MENTEIEEKIKKENKRIVLFAIIGIIEIIFILFMKYQTQLENKRREYEQKIYERNYFNSQYEQYAGKVILGSQVKSLIRKVHENNRNSENRQISIVGKYVDITDIISTQEYMIFLEYDENGYINAVRIEEHN